MKQARTRRHRIKIALGDKDPGGWNNKIRKSKRYPRHWITTKDLNIQLLDGRWIDIPMGFIWDGASIPKWLWWLFKPMDEGKLGDLEHDFLWVNWLKEAAFFNSTFEARRFSEKERLRVRKLNAPKKRIKNFITHHFLRLFGGFFYSRQIKIP